MSDKILEEEIIDERMEAQERLIAEHNIKREEHLKNMIIQTAYYPSSDNRSSFYVEYYIEGDSELKIELVRTSSENDLLNRVLEAFTYDDILERTVERENAFVQMNQDFDQFVQWKNEGKISIDNQNSDETVSKLNLEELENVNTEELFKLKLEIFEKEEVQNSENRELRSAIRKSKDSIELFHYYWMIENESNPENE